MRILIVSDAWYPQVNGVVRTYEHLCDGLRLLGHTVQVIGPADFRFTVPMPGYSEIRLAIWPYGRLQRLIRAFAPDHIHIATEGPLGWAARRYCLRHGHDFTTSYHTHFPDYVAKRLAYRLPFLYRPVHAIARAVVRKFHTHARAMMVATQSLEEELLAWDFKTPMRRLTRGADLDLFKPAAKTLFKDLKQPIALYVGRVAVEKNLEDFLQMDWPGSRIIVGDGPSLYALQQKYPEARFVGKKFGTDLAAHYQSADVFVFPSRTDTFGIVLIEAMACGLPIAAYRVTGPRDIITQDFLGALTDDDLGGAARRALICGTIEDRIAHVRQHYTWEAASRQFEDILLERDAPTPAIPSAA